jgi:hypothetical protein
MLGRELSALRRNQSEIPTLKNEAVKKLQFARVRLFTLCNLLIISPRGDYSHSGIHFGPLPDHTKIE